MNFDYLVAKNSTTYQNATIINNSNNIIILSVIDRGATEDVTIKA